MHSFPVSKPLVSVGNQQGREGVLPETINACSSSRLKLYSHDKTKPRLN